MSSIYVHPLPVQKLTAQNTGLPLFRPIFFGRVPSGRAIAQYLSGRGEEYRFNTFSTARPERILAHIPHALRLVHSPDKSGDRSRLARQEGLRAGSRAHSKKM